MQPTTTETKRRTLSQHEIDAAFKAPAPEEPKAHEIKATRYDFLRPHCIPQSQLRAIRLLHENFVRSLASSLSAYLRSYVTVNLVSFEQISYQEFLEGLPSPTIIAGLSLRPFEGTGVLEISPQSFFPILEMLLGGKSQNITHVSREITDIELRLVEMLLRVIVRDLHESWKAAANIDFAVQCIEKEPQLLQVLAPSEAVIAIGMEIHAGAAMGPLNLAIPALAIKMMRQRLDQQWITRRATTTVEGQERMLRMMGHSETEMQVALEGSTIRLRDLLRLRADDVIVLDIPVDQSVHCLINGQRQFKGHLAQAGNKSVFVVDDCAAD